MKFLLWIPLTALLMVMGCNDSTEKMTAPADLPNGGDGLDLEKMAAQAAAQAAFAPRCVQLRYISETGIVRSVSSGNGCSLCGTGRAVSVTAVIWNGAVGNNAIGKARCASSSSSTIVAGSAVAVDHGSGLFGVAASMGSQVSGVPGCGLTSTVTDLLNRSNRLVTCLWQ